MASNSKPASGDSPKEFLVLAIPEDAQVGANLRLLNVAGTQNAAEKAVEQLGANVLGRVAVVERKLKSSLEVEITHDQLINSPTNPQEITLTLRGADLDTIVTSQSDGGQNGG